MPTAVQIATTFGIQHSREIAEVAQRTGTPLEAAYALVQMESMGRHVYGGDDGGVFADQKLPVTEANFKTFIRRINNGAKSNGVGILQITHKSHFPAAVKMGLELWKVEDNLEYGFRLLMNHYRTGKTWKYAGTRYNGKESYGITYARRVGEWKARLSKATEDPDARAQICC